MIETRNLAEELHAITEKINPTIVRAESVFEMAGLRTMASIPLGKNKLVWAKKDLVWKLFVVCKDGHTDLLTTRSRAIRLEALKALPELKRAIEDAAVLDEEEARRIIKDATAWVSDLEERNRR